MRTHLALVLLIGGLAGVAAAQPATGIVPPVFHPVSNDPAGAPAIYVAPVVPPAFRLLADPAVQADIGLTADQKAAAEKVREGSAIPTRGLSLGRFGFVPGDVLRAAANQRTTDFLGTGLTKEQRTRLDQILFQLREKEFGRPLAFAMSARDLGLRPDQVEDVFNLKALRVEEIEKAVTSGKRFERVKGEVEAANGETFEKMAEMLTRAQRERLKEMRGKPFAGKVDLAALEAPRLGQKEVRTPSYPKDLFGVYDFELRYLESHAIRTAIGIPEGNADAIRRRIAEWNEEFERRRLRPESAGELSDLTAKALDDLLAAKSRARFDEIMVLRRLGYGGWEAACGYPPVVQALKISPNQLTSLKGGASIDEALTKSQREMLTKLGGEHFQLNTFIDDPVPARFRLPTGGGAIQPPKDPPAPSFPISVARDFLRLTDRLKLNDDQVKKLRDLAEDEPKIRELIRKELALDDTPPVAGAGRAQTTVNVVTERFRAAVERQCWDVLDEPQRSIARKIFGRGGRN
jgi:hypothetical protein